MKSVRGLECHDNASCYAKRVILFYYYTVFRMLLVFAGYVQVFLTRYPSSLSAVTTGKARRFETRTRNI
jgi:hypothetical protein